MRSAFYRACFPAAKQARKPVWRVHQLPDGLNFPTAGGHALEAVEQHHRCKARAGGIYRWQESVGNHLFQPDEYLLPADLVSLALAEMEILLETAQGWNGRSSRDSERRSSCQPNTDVSCRTPPKTKLRRGSHI